MAIGLCCASCLLILQMAGSHLTQRSQNWGSKRALKMIVIISASGGRYGRGRIFFIARIFVGRWRYLAFGGLSEMDYNHRELDEAEVRHGDGNARLQRWFEEKPSFEPCKTRLISKCDRAKNEDSASAFSALARSASVHGQIWLRPHPPLSGEASMKRCFCGFSFGSGGLWRA